MAITGGDKQIFKTALTSNTATAVEEVGTMRTEYDSTNGTKVYMYVLAAGAIAVGTPCTLKGTTGYTVGFDTVNSLGHKRCMGVGIGTITDAYYGWIQVRGYHAAILKVNGAAACTTAYVELVVLCKGVQSLKYNNTTTVIGATTHIVFAGITADESLATACTTVSGYLHCM